MQCSAVQFSWVQLQITPFPGCKILLLLQPTPPGDGRPIELLTLHLPTLRSSSVCLLRASRCIHRPIHRHFMASSSITERHSRGWWAMEVPRCRAGSADLVAQRVVTGHFCSQIHRILRIISQRIKAGSRRAAERPHTPVWATRFVRPTQRARTSQRPHATPQTTRRPQSWRAPRPTGCAAAAGAGMSGGADMLVSTGAQRLAWPNIPQLLCPLCAGR